MRIVDIITEARSHRYSPRFYSGKEELRYWYDNSGLSMNWKEQESWGVSMTVLPKLGINPGVGISEDTPKGIYFYPINYVAAWMHGLRKLPWGDDFPYIQAFQYDNSHQMTKASQVAPDQLKAALNQYCPDEIIAEVAEEGQYNNDPYWFIYACLIKLGKSDETTIIRWNKVLRDLGFTSVMDNGAGWIAPNEPTQGVILDPRIIKQVRTFDNYKRKGRLK